MPIGMFMVDPPHRIGDSAPGTDGRVPFRVDPLPKHARANQGEKVRLG